MSVVGKGRRCGRVVACRSGLFTTSNSVALVLLTASPAAAQSAAEGNRNPTAFNTRGFTGNGTVMTLYDGTGSTSAPAPSRSPSTAGRPTESK